MEQVLCHKWRDELGKKIRKKILSYIRVLVKQKGEVNGKGFILDLNSEIHTILPLNVSCYSSKRVVVFVSKIRLDGNNVLKFTDIQDKWIDPYVICIDSLLLLLDQLESID